MSYLPRPLIRPIVIPPNNRLPVIRGPPPPPSLQQPAAMFRPFPPRLTPGWSRSGKNSISPGTPTAIIDSSSDTSYSRVSTPSSLHETNNKKSKCSCCQLNSSTPSSSCPVTRQTIYLVIFFLFLCFVIVIVLLIVLLIVNR